MESAGPGTEDVGPGTEDTRRPRRADALGVVSVEAAAPKDAAAAIVVAANARRMISPTLLADIPLISYTTSAKPSEEDDPLASSNVGVSLFC